MRSSLTRLTIEECVARLAPELDDSIAPLRTCLEILRLDRGMQATVEAERRRMELHLVQLLTLADDLSAINAIYRGQMRVSRSRVRLATMVGFALELADPVIDNTGCKLQVEIPPMPVWLDADLLLLGQALANLLLDAVKSAPVTGRIRLRATLAKENLEVMIEWAQRPDSISGQSLCLGVTTARVIIEMHGGSLGSSIDASGRGRALAVHLPLSRGSS